MTLLLIWLALSVVLVACVCRVLALSGPDDPEKVIHTDIRKAFPRVSRASSRTN
jgi:hypothetical protein